MSNYTIEVTENVVNLDVLKDHDIVIEIKSSDNFITFDTPSGYPILFTSGILPVSRVGSGYLIENLTSGNTIVRTLGDQSIGGYKTFSNDVVTSGNLAIRSQPAFINPSYFPVFISDPSTFSRNIYTRTPSQIKSDLGLNNVQNIALSGINFSAGSGLIGGGNLLSSRTFDIGQGDGLTVSADSVGVNSTVIRTSGDQTITGFTTFGGSGIRITTGAIGLYRKDIVFKANVGTLFSNTVTIIPTNNLYTDRTYYLPEAGADADFVLTAGSQVITGPKTFTNSLIFNSGSFQSLRVGVTDVSLSGHTHTSSNITDFNISVDSRITNANLQPSGNYSIIGHTHTISNITGLQTALDNKQASGNYSLIGHIHNISDITSLQTLLDNKQPSGNYANLIHTHTVNDITNFASGVDSRIISANLQPSGSYSLTGHSHLSSDITNFNSSVSGLLTITAISGISGVLVTNNGTSHIVSLNDPSIQLSDITDLTNNAKTFLLTPSSNNLSALLSDETGSGVLVFNNSPTFTGIPLTPTANAGTNNTQIASTAFVRTEISNLVASAPSTLDTLNELATALGNDPNFATTITNNLAGKANLSDATFTGSISGPSGNFVSLKVNNVDVSASGHSHTSSNITDFNSSVSGLLPVKDIIGGSGISIGSVSGTYTVTAFGVAASSASSLTTEVYNSTASTIPKGSVVYIDGGHGNLPTVSLAIANGESGSSKTYGITATNISSNNNGNVVVIGSLIDFDTNQFGAVEGTTLYLSPSISGAMTTTKPVAPNHLVSVGKIVRNHSTQGVIQVNIQNGFELGELHNVATDGTSDGQFLRYNYSSGLWIPSSSGNFTSLSVNNTGVSVNGHTHSSSDITNFNSSVSGLLSPYQLVLTNPVTGTGVANHIAYWNSSSGIVADSGQLYWDATNNRLGIGITSPLDLIHISGSTASSVGIRFDNNDGHGGSVQADNGQLYLNSSTATAARLSGRKIRLGDGGASACALELGSVGTISQDGNGGGLSFSGTTGQFSNGLHVTAGNVGIGTTTPNQKLDVNGNVNIDGNLTFDSFTESVVTIGNSSTSQTISLTSGTVQTCTLTGNCTFTMPTATAGKSFTLFLNSGAGNFTATFTGVRWADSATPTATILANKVDIFSFISDGTYWYGSFSQNYG